MPSWKPYLVILQNENGEFKSIPIQEEQTEPTESESGLAQPPTPEQDRISKEVKKDYSVKGRIEKIKKVAP